MASRARVPVLDFALFILPPTLLKKLDLMGLNVMDASGGNPVPQAGIRHFSAVLQQS
jgi:hypothetical protein